MKHPIMKLYNLINGCTALLVVALMTACSDKGGDSPDTGNTGTPDDDQTVAVGITTEVITRANVTTGCRDEHIPQDLRTPRCAQHG